MGLAIAVSRLFSLMQFFCVQCGTGVIVLNQFYEKNQKHRPVIYGAIIGRLVVSGKPLSTACARTLPIKLKENTTVSYIATHLLCFSNCLPHSYLTFTPDSSYRRFSRRYFGARLVELTTRQSTRKLFWWNFLGDKFYFAGV